MKVSPTPPLGPRTGLKDTDPRHTVKTVQGWIRDNLEGPSMNPPRDLNPIKRLWRDLKMAIDDDHPTWKLEVFMDPKSCKKTIRRL